MTLRPLTEADEAAFLDYAADFDPGHRYEGVTTHEAFLSFLAVLEDYRLGRNLPAGRVASRAFFAFDGGAIVGRINFRPELTEAMLTDGGHVGYEVRRSRRRQGWGRRILARLLSDGHARGLDRVLLTCDADNRGSQGVILANGGVWEGEGPAGPDGRIMRRYWVPVPPAPPGALVSEKGG